MGFLYGDISHHLSRSNFNFYKIYPNRRAMHQEVEEIPEDGLQDVYLPEGVYVLIDYSSSGNYAQNYNIDLNWYSHNIYENLPELEKPEPVYYSEGNFDYTVWQVQYIKEIINNEEETRVRCIPIARLHSVLPTFETVGSVKIDILEPISGGDYFGRGKNIWTINTISGLPENKI